MTKFFSSLFIFLSLSIITACAEYRSVNIPDKISDETEKGMQIPTADGDATQGKIVIPSSDEKNSVGSKEGEVAPLQNQPLKPITTAQVPGSEPQETEAANGDITSHGGNFDCTLKTDGSVTCSGQDITNFFQLSNLPNIYQVAAAKGLHGLHACALSDEGDVYCWGKNDKGQLGDGTTHDSVVPLKVSLKDNHGLPTKAEYVSTGESFSCALLEDSSPICWGQR